MEQFCIHCGKPVTSDARFCKYCGKEIEQDREPSPTNLVDDLHYQMAKELMGNPPISNIQNASKQRISFLQILFSFNGRIGRLTYFLAMILLLSVEIPIVANLESKENYTLINLVFLAFLWAASSITVKRWHDLDKSPWWLLTMIVPLWNVITGFELLFVKGTDSKNKYGEKEFPIETFKAIGFICLILLVLFFIYAISTLF